jgi:hypothetical protein
MGQISKALRSEVTKDQFSSLRELLSNVGREIEVVVKN